MYVFIPSTTDRIIYTICYINSISPADDEEVFWGLEDNKRDTPVYLLGD